MKTKVQKTSYEKEKRGSNRSGGHRQLKHGSLFSGIGGFDLAAQWVGWENVFHCEWNDFGKKILNYYWPNAISYDDITKTNFTIHRATIDVLSGGFPCQPFSLAGKRKGTDDERHLWPEMLRAIREIQPSWIVGENVFGLVNWNNGLVFEQVQIDLENEGYEVQSFILPAAAVNAPHRRDRIWIVAHSKLCANELSAKRWMDLEREILHRSEWKKKTIGFDNNTKNATNTNCNGCDKCNGNNEKYTSKRGFNALNDINKAAMHTNGTSKQGKHIGQTRERKFNGSNSRDGFNNFQNFPTQSPICGGDDGLPTELDGITFSKWKSESIKAAGNAIVPQVAKNIFTAINAYSRAQFNYIS